MKFPLRPLDILRYPAVRLALAAAWVESKPGLAGRHEEGGFIVLDGGEELSVRRWPHRRREPDQGAGAPGMRGGWVADRGNVPHAPEYRA